MRKSILKLLICPNYKVDEFTVFAHELKRGNRLLANIAHHDILSDDDIKTGFILNKKAGTVYPITEYILSMLSDQDADRRLYTHLLSSALDYSPQSYKQLISDNIYRLKPASSDEIGNWNREEMGYYDSAVDTEHLRKAFLENIKNNPLWHIYIERKCHLINHLDLSRINNILEIGCGNARTVAWIFSPLKYSYSYIGADISLKRLMLAKRVIMEGDFVQCSALNLPFKNGTFSAVISFGVLHHLPNPLVGMGACVHALNNGGYLLIHEPIRKPKKLLPEGKLHFARKILTTYEHSEHDNEIILGDSLKLLADKNMKLKHIHFSVSFLRTVLSRLIIVFSRINRNRLAWELLISTDDIFIKLFCFRPNRFGPGGVFLVLRKG